MLRIPFRRRPLKDRGATAIEYGIIASLIGVGIIAGVTATGTKTDAMFVGLAGKMKSGAPTLPTIAPSMTSLNSLLSGYNEPGVAGITPVVNDQMFGHSGTSYTRDQGNGDASFRMQYAGFTGALGTVWSDTGVIDNGLIVASERRYGPGNVYTKTQYFNSATGYYARVEMNASTGAVVATEYYNSATNSWGPQQP